MAFSEDLDACDAQLRVGTKGLHVRAQQVLREGGRMKKTNKVKSNKSLYQTWGIF